jgi:hypothetical protein
MTGPEPARSTRAAQLGAAVVLVAAVLVAAALGGCAAVPDRQQVVAERGTEVMPFDLEATTHHFAPTADGGVQTVVADDPTDAAQVRLVQAHLQAEADAFARGDFGDPEQIHGGQMPGLAVLRESAGALQVRYRPLADGAEIAYTSADPAVVRALHDWFAAQVSDHGQHAG